MRHASRLATVIAVTGSICDDNALTLDIRPDRELRARGTTVLDYREAARLALDAGVSHITVSAQNDRARRAVGALRAVQGAARREAGDLPAPRYPKAYVEQLRGVAAAHRRLGDVRAVRTELGISKSAVRFRLGLAHDLGPERLGRRGGWATGEGCVVEPA